MSNVVPLQHRGVDSDADDRPFITPGEYSAVYVRHAGMMVYRQPKLRVDFRLLAMPDIVLPRWYRVRDYRGGRISARPHSDLIRELSDVLNRRLRSDRIPVGALEGMVVHATVTTVTQNKEQEKLSEHNQYSVIGSLRP